MQAIPVRLRTITLSLNCSRKRLWPALRGTGWSPMPISL